MILGLGTDIVEVARIQSAHTKWGADFLQRTLRTEEIAYCLSHRAPAPHIAARFAAKEAVSKAFGTGIGVELGWHDLEVVREVSGRPLIILHGNGIKLLAACGAKKILISLSHTEYYATATAMLEG